MTRIEVNVMTGEQVEIDLTPAEVAAAEAAHLAWEQRPIVLAPTLVEQILASPIELAKLKTALGVTV